MHAAEAGDAAHHGIHDGLNECRSHSCIDSIATCGKNLGSRLDSFGLRRHDHSRLHGELSAALKAPVHCRAAFALTRV
jgi:hypothetical protein